VKRGDVVYHLGDFYITGFKKEFVKDVDNMISRLNGNIHLIIGNHDNSPVLSAKGFRSKKIRRCVTVEGQRIILDHYSLRSWQFKSDGAWMLFGHSHGALEVPATQPTCDVGVQANGGFPVAFEDLKKRFNAIS